MCGPSATTRKPELGAFADLPPPCECVVCGGQGRGRTVDLPSFSRLRQPPPRSSAVGLDDGRTVSGPLHRSAAFLRRCERVVCLAHRHDLAIPSLRADPVPTGYALFHVERAALLDPLLVAGNREETSNHGVNQPTGRHTSCDSQSLSPRGHQPFASVVEC